jgi:hypothetical protein
MSRMALQTLVTCPCSNVSVRGHVLPAGAYPNIPRWERSRLAVRLIGNRSICVRDFGCVCVHSNSARCADIVCETGSHILRFFVGRCPPQDLRHTRRPSAGLRGDIRQTGDRTGPSEPVRPRGHRAARPHVQPPRQPNQAPLRTGALPPIGPRPFPRADRQRRRTVWLMDLRALEVWTPCSEARSVLQTFQSTSSLRWLAKLPQVRQVKYLRVSNVRQPNWRPLWFASPPADRAPKWPPWPFVLVQTASGWSSHPLSVGAPRRYLGPGCEAVRAIISAHV